MKKSYLQKQALFPPLIQFPPSEDLQMVIVIPAYDESSTVQSLEALLNCTPPPCDVEVIIVVNYSDQAEKALRQRSRQQVTDLRSWIAANTSDWIRFHVLFTPDLPRKKAGVGLARKIGLDEGVRRLITARGRVDDPKGILVCFDADSLCRSDYLQEIYQFFRDQPAMEAVSIGYAHPLEGEAFPEEIYRSIAAYELHLRYFLLAKKWAGCPHAIETIGSAMAVRQWAYQQQGGMNQRKAGEDFYFLHKFIRTGRTGEIRKPLVIPSPRISHRVPFGTGKAVGDLVDNQSVLKTYAFPLFLDLRALLSQLDALYESTGVQLEEILTALPEPVRSFLQEQSFADRLQEIKEHTKNLAGFEKRFFRWFDAFLVMKYVHFARDRFYPNVPVEQAASELLHHCYPKQLPEGESTVAILRAYRSLAFDSEGS